MKKLISIVIPVYNEQLNLKPLIKELTSFARQHLQYRFEFILVENGSTDDSYKILLAYAVKDSRIKIVRLSRNFGCDDGILAGMSYAQGDALVIMMADLQEPVTTISQFIKKWEAGYEIVYGIVKKRTSSPVRNLMSKLFYKLLNLLTGKLFPENVSDFRLIDRSVYQTINRMPEHNKYLRGLINWTGFRQIGIPFNRRPRYAGESKANLLTVLKVAANGIFSFSYLPLRLVSLIGFVTTIISFFLGAIYLYLYFLWGRIVPGVATIILLLLFLFGVLFFILGIISEYLMRIYDETKNRPLFIVKNTVNL